MVSCWSNLGFDGDRNTVMTWIERDVSLVGCI